MSREAKIPIIKDYRKPSQRAFEIIRNEAANPGKRVHIIASGDKWAVKMAGASRATKIYDTKEEALKRAKSIVKHGNAEVIVNHRDDGSFTIIK